MSVSVVTMLVPKAEISVCLNELTVKLRAHLANNLSALKCQWTSVQFYSTGSSLF